MAKTRHWLYLLLLAFVWGSSFILIKKALFTADGLPIFTGPQVGGLRIVLAGLFMVPFIWNKMKAFNKKTILPLLVVGLCGNAIPAVLFAVAQTKIPSSLAGMLNAMVPLFSLIIAFFIFKVKVKSWQVAGLILGLFSSIGLLYFSGNGLQGEIHMGFALLVVLATLCYAISLNTIKQFLQNESAIAITGLALLLVSPIGIGILLATDVTSTLQQNDSAVLALGAVSLLAVFGTALSLMLFNRLVQETNTIFASSVTYLIPVVAIGWGVVDGELINTFQILCVFAMIGGIILINRK